MGGPWGPTGAPGWAEVCPRWPLCCLSMLPLELVTGNLPCKYRAFVAAENKACNHVNDGKSFYKKENLSTIDQYNEYVMTGFRTIWGVSANFIEKNFNLKFKKYFMDRIQKHIDQKNIVVNNDIYTTTNQGRFLADGIASDLFLINLK